MATFATSFATKVGDNVYIFKGLTDDDIAKIKAVIAKAAANESSITQLQSDLDALELKQAQSGKGHGVIAYKDLALEENQAGLEEMVYYKVPRTAEGTFIDLTSEETRGEAVLDHFDVWIKDTSGVHQIGSEDFKASFDDLASLAGNNVFTGDNTVKSLTITETQDQGTLTDEKTPKFGTVKAHVAAAVATAKSEVIGEVGTKGYLTAEVVDDYPEDSAMTAGKLYLRAAADHFTD